MNEWLVNAVDEFCTNAGVMDGGDGVDGQEAFLALWSHAAAHGLSRVGIPEAYGGAGGGGPEIAELLRLLTLKTGRIGLPISLMISQIVAHYMIDGHGSEAQKATWLPQMAEGRFPSAFAVSEPGVGGHPAKLTTQGELHDGTWSLNGEKAYISNGPLAGLVLVLAVVGEDHGKKRYSLFLVKGHTPGMDHSSPMDLPFFQPAQHGSLKLQDVKLPQESLLGTPGEAYIQMVLPFRRYEDAMIMASATGGFGHLLEVLGQEADATNNDLCDSLGSLAGRLEALKLVTRRCAELTEDAGEASEAEAGRLLIHFRELMHTCIDTVGRLIGTGLTLDRLRQTLLADLEAASNIGKHVASVKCRKIGREVASV